MPEEGVVVDVHHGVGGDDIALARDHQRIDLRLAGVVVLPEVVQRLQNARHRAGHVTGNARLVHRLPCLKGVESVRRVDALASDGRRRLGGDVLDVDPTLRGDHDDGFTLATVEGHAEVEFVREVDCRLDEDPIHVVAFEIHAENRLGGLAEFVPVARDLDAAGLPTPADVDLCLDRDGVPHVAAGVDRFVDARRQPGVGRRNPGVGEEPLRLILV